MRYCLFVTSLLFSTVVFSQKVFTNYRDGQVYVQLKAGALKPLLNQPPHQISMEAMAWLKALEKTFGITGVKRPFHQASDHATLPSVLKITFSKVEKVNSFLEELQKLKQVTFAEKVPLLKTDALPNDPTFPAYLNQINAQNAWNVFNGNSNITVAIVDNAVMWTHQDLVANTYTNSLEIPNNSTDDDGNGYIDDVNGYDVADLDNNAIPTNTLMDHGTHCAGIAGARTDNSVGIASIGWNIKIIPVKVTYNGSSTTDIDAGYEGIIYATKAKARIISCSWGGPGASAIEQTVVDYAWNKGSIVIASAGNANTTVLNFPGAYNHVYCVGSVGSGDLKSGFSNYGSWVDVSAPGENIYSTVPSAGTGTYQIKSGTSMATPMVAGLAALMLSKCSWMSSTDVLNCISSTAVNIYTLGANSSYSTGLQLGAGRIEAFQAMNCANAFLTVPPVANFFAFPLNTCPNTPVSFYDSSLYAPTSYTWSFQGGTPATSTLSAPIVQWSTPGTYSVSLTVANGNGIHTKTKLNYISAAGPQALPLSEGFETFPFVPVGWTAKNANYDLVFWERFAGTNAGGFGTSTACARFDNYNFVTFGELEEMRTPKYNLSNVHIARLRYDVAYARFGAANSDTLEVKLSLNCGATWSLVSIKGGTTLATRSDLGTYFIPSSTEWRRDTFDLSSTIAGQGNVMFAFINRGHYGQPIYIDNINLFFPTPTVNINSPNPSCVNSTVSPSATITGAASYTWSFPGGSPAISTQSNPVVTYANPGIYTIELTGVNGTSSVTATQTLNISAFPTVSANTPTICNGAQAVFNFSGASVYTLTPGGTTGSLQIVSPASTSIYTVTGSNGICSSSITSTVVVNPNPTLTANQPTICAGSTAGFTLSGASSYTTQPGNITASQFTINPLSTTVYTIEGSDGLCTSSITAQVLVNPLPTITVNSPSVCYGQSVALTASGASTYTWSSGSNASSIPISPLTNTSYVVTGSSLNCISSATSVVFVNPSFTVSAQSASNNVCSMANCLLSASGANSYSWSTGAFGSTVFVNPVSSSTFVVTGISGICSQTAAVVVSVIQTPSLSFTVTPGYSICPGGSATLQVSGAYSTFAWGQPIVFGTLNVVFPSGSTTYTLNAGNPANGCYTSSVIPITISTPPAANISVSNVSCSGMCNATVTASGVSGVGPYQYTVLPVNCTSLPCSNLCPGPYTLQIKDALGCSGAQNFSIAAPAPLNITSIQMGPASCAVCSDGSLQVNVSGGTVPYFYLWIPTGGSNSTASNLAPGCYTVVVSDANLCTSQSTACVDFHVGFQHIESSDIHFELYPNPAEGFVLIRCSEPEFKVVVMNNLGQVVLESSHHKQNSALSTESLARGVYYIEVDTGQQRFRKKLLLQ